MSPRVATVAFLIALFLGGAAWYVSRPPAVSKAKLVPLMDVPVGDVARIDFQFGSSSVAVSKNPATRDWVLTSGDSGQSWVASDAAVRGFLRLLAEDRAEAIPANAEAERGAWNGVSLRTWTENCAIQVYPSPMGGRALAVVIPRSSNQTADSTAPAPSRADLPRVWLAPERVALFQPSSVAAWREKRLLPGNGGQAAKLVVESGSAKTTVVKSGAGWVVNPETTDGEHLGGMRADPRTVSRVLGLLESAEVVSFPVDPKMAGTGLDKPAAKIEITSTYNVSDLAREGEKRLEEAPRDTPDVEPTLTVVRTVEIGGLADAEGRTLYAMVQAEFRQTGGGNSAMIFFDWNGGVVRKSPLYGPTLCIVPRAALEGIAVAPEMYAMRVPLANASPADIERVRFTDATGAAAEISLTADGWKTAGDTPRVLGESETARVREFLTFFTDAEADSIRPAAGFTPQEGDESVQAMLVPRGMKDGMEFTLVRRSPQGATPEVFVTMRGRSSILVYRSPRASDVFEEVSKLGR